MSLLPDSNEGLPPPPTTKDIRPVEAKASRFDQSLRDFMAAANLEAYTDAFANTLLVQSSQDLCLLSIEGIKIFKNNREKKLEIRSLLYIIC